MKLKLFRICMDGTVYCYVVDVGYAEAEAKAYTVFKGINIDRIDIIGVGSVEVEGLFDTLSWQ